MALHYLSITNFTLACANIHIGADDLLLLHVSVVLQLQMLLICCDHADQFDIAVNAKNCALLCSCPKGDRIAPLIRNQQIYADRHVANVHKGLKIQRAVQ